MQQKQMNQLIQQLENYTGVLETVQPFRERRAGEAKFTHEDEWGGVS